MDRGGGGNFTASYEADGSFVGIGRLSSPGLDFVRCACIRRYPPPLMAMTFAERSASGGPFDSAMKPFQFLVSATWFAALHAAEPVRLASPDHSWFATVTADPAPTVELRDADGTLAISQEIGLVLGNDNIPAATATIAGHQERTCDQIIEPPVRQKAAKLRDHFNETTITFSDGTRLLVRLYDNGLAYRFAISRDGEVTVVSEKRICRFDGDPTVYFGAEDKGFFSHNEVSYEKTPLTQLKRDRLASLPMTIARTNDKGLLVLSESALENYPGQWIRAGENCLLGTNPGYPSKIELRTHLDAYPAERENFIAKIDGKRLLPWRTVATARRQADLLVNMLNYLVADPPRIADTAWIQPGKVAWDWWHDWTWDGKKLPISNETYQKYIDFASDYGIPFIILDEGWYHSGDLTRQSDGIDVPALVSYGKRKNVGIILWAGSATLEKQFDTVMPQFGKWGVRGLKVDFFQRDDQPEIVFYWKLAADAAKRHLTLDFHGAHKPAGLQRAYPNVLNIEGVKGMEQLKWSRFTTPEHDTQLPYTRMVAGFFDYTPGAMKNSQPADFQPNNSAPSSMGTRCHELAKYVIFDAPLQMLCDAPPHYRREPGTMTFLRQVPTTWDDSLALDGRIGEFAVMARRSGDTWFIGAMTNEQARDLTLDLTPLGQGPWEFTVWQDTPESATKATAFATSQSTLETGAKLPIKLAPSGGYTAILRPVKR